MMLCDAAESVGGKLYILGGGWLQVLADQPVNMALAIRVDVGWEYANVRRAIAAVLVTQDGEPFELEGRAVESRGEFEMGRPPGLESGSPLVATLAMAFGGLTLPPGAYEWRLTVDDDLVDVAAFRAVRPLT
jgi:hypothetical protein